MSPPRRPTPPRRDPPVQPPTLAVVLDTETSGLPAHRPDCPVRAVSIGAAGYVWAPGEGWTPVGTFTRVMRPPVFPSAAVWDRAEEVHGLSRALVEKATPARDVWALFAETLGYWLRVASGRAAGQPGHAAHAAPPVGYLAWNADFDWRMLRRWAGDCGGDPSALAFPDVRLSPGDLGPGAGPVVAPHGCLMEAWKAHPANNGAVVKAGSGSLDKARQALGLVAREGHHDAGQDAVFAGDVLQAMVAWRAGSVAAAPEDVQP